MTKQEKKFPSWLVISVFILAIFIVILVVSHNSKIGNTKISRCEELAKEERNMTNPSCDVSSFLNPTTWCDCEENDKTECAEWSETENTRSCEKLSKTFFDRTIFEIKKQNGK